MARRKRRRGIALPWEQRGTWLRALLAGQRWKMLLLGVLILVAGWMLWDEAQHRARLRSTRVAITQIKNAIAEFRSEFGRCPKSIVELVHPPEPGEHYLHEVPVDGWGRRLWVRCPARHDPKGVEVISAGPSGSFMKPDNIQ